MSTHNKSIEDELANSHENKKYLLKLIEENSYLRKQNELRTRKRNKRLEDIVNQLSSDDSIDSDTSEAASDDEPLMKRMRRTSSDNNNNTIEKHQSFSANVDVHSALKEMDDKINVLSKATAELDTALELYREIPFISLQSAYSPSDPVPSYMGDADYTISDDRISVNVPAKSEAEVNDLNEILKNDNAFKRAVRNNDMYTDNSTTSGEFFCILRLVYMDN